MSLTASICITWSSTSRTSRSTSRAERLPLARTLTTAQGVWESEKNTMPVPNWL